MNERTTRTPIRPKWVSFRLMHYCVCVCFFSRVLPFFFAHVARTAIGLADVLANCTFVPPAAPTGCCPSQLTLIQFRNIDLISHFFLAAITLVS